ncbi:Jerky protein-like 13, partial [Homarus americanus]
MDSAKKSGGVKRKHRALSIAEKVEVLKKLDSGGIGSSTVYDIKKQKEKLLKFFYDRFRVSKEKQLIHELLAYVKDVTNPDAKELSSRINEDVLR